MDISTGLGIKEIREYLSSGDWELREMGGMPFMVNIKTPSNMRLINSFAFETLKKRHVISEKKTAGSTKLWKLETKQAEICEPDLENTTILYTKSADKHRGILEPELRKALAEFPELKGKTITIGMDNGGKEGCSLSAIYPKKYRLNINLFLARQHKALLSTIGWGFTQFVQVQEGKPNNDKHTDIWLLARSPLFRDNIPAHLKLPEKIVQDWDTYKERVGELCIQALMIRSRVEKNSHYIKWLEKKIRKLAEENVR